MIRIRKITHGGDRLWAVTCDAPICVIAHKELAQAIAGWRRYRPLRQPRLVAKVE